MRHLLRAAWCCLLAAALVSYSSPTWAIPPLVSGDIPTADLGTYELFFGYVLKDGGAVTEEELPFWELVYGLTKVQELTIEAPIVRRDDPAGTTTGIGDLILGTKYRFVGKPAADSGLSISLEVKLPTGDEDRGLGAGAVAVDLKARGGFELGREVVYFNLGRTWVGEDGKDNTWFYAGVWDHPVGSKLRLLTEIYGKTADEPGAHNTLAGTEACARVRWVALTCVSTRAGDGISDHGTAVVSENTIRRTSRVRGHRRGGQEAARGKVSDANHAPSLPAVGGSGSVPVRPPEVRAAPATSLGFRNRRPRFARPTMARSRWLPTTWCGT